MKKLVTLIVASVSAQFLERKEPSCFYCSKDEITGQMDNLYDFDIKSDCEDVCLSSKENEFHINTDSDCKSIVQDITNNLEILNHYVFDDRVKTCFSFDPRHEERYPLFGFLDESDKNENQKRQLQTTIKSCSELTTYCFRCEGLSSGVCKWNQNTKVCSNAPLDKNNQQVRIPDDRWWDAYGNCKKLTKRQQGPNLCDKVRNNNGTQFNYTIDSNPLSDTKDPTAYIPAGYYCEWQWEKDETKDLEWQIQVIRQFSQYKMESIQIWTYTARGPYRSYDDAYIRAKSYRYATDEALNLKYQAYSFLDLKSPVVRVEIAVKNNIATNTYKNEFPNSFTVIVEDQKASTSIFQVVFIAISVCIMCILLGTCASRGYFGWQQSGGQVDWSAFDEPDPDWDQDQLRMYNIRRLEQEIDEINEDRQEDGYEEDENDRAHRQRLEAKLQKLQVENAKEFVGALEDLIMDSKTQKHNSVNCTICLSVMEEGSEIKRIPSCMHSFHPNCLRKWFEEKISEDVQKCPQCNQELKTFKMKECKQKNIEAGFIEPVLRGSNHQGSRVGVAGPSQNRDTELTNKHELQDYSNDSSDSSFNQPDLTGRKR